MDSKNWFIMCRSLTFLLLAVLVLSPVASAGIPGLIAHWPFDENEGALAEDVSGSGNDGSLYGNFMWVTGKYNTATEYNGNADTYMECPPLLLDIRSFSIAFWANPNLSQRNQATVIGQHDRGWGYYGESLYIQLSTNIVFGFYGTHPDGRQMQVATAAGSIRTGSWNHIVCIYDYPNETIMVYINGEMSISRSCPPFTGTGGMFNIGRWQGGNHRAWGGKVDDVRVYQHVLTDEEIISVRDNVSDPEANAPQPANEADDVTMDTMLKWKAGGFGNTSDVYFGTSSENVNTASPTDGRDVLVGQGQTTTEFDPGLLAKDTTYFWRVDTVNTSDNSTLKGSVWTFTTGNGIKIDDMEGYKNLPNRWIYLSWFDGWDDPNNGSVVGNGDMPETALGFVIEGGQSLPMEYDNTTANISEATISFDPTLDFSKGGPNTLSLQYRGLAPGFVEDAEGNVTLTGGGTNGIGWTESDEFRYVYQQLSGNGSIIARVNSLQYVHTSAIAAVMIRETTAVGSKMAAVGIHAGGGLKYFARTETDLNGTNDHDVETDEQKALTTPIWLKIERVGDEFNGYYATDEAGTEWVACAWNRNPQTINMPPDVTIGLGIASSHTPGHPTVAEISNITTIGNVTGERVAELIADESGDHPTNEEGYPIYVVVTDSSNESAVFTTDDVNATQMPYWTFFSMPFSEMSGLDLTSIALITLGVGDPEATQPSGAQGKIWIDDIRLTGFPEQ